MRRCRRQWYLWSLTRGSRKERTESSMRSFEWMPHRREQNHSIFQIIGQLSNRFLVVCIEIVGIIHAVGPQIKGHDPTKKEERQLCDAYAKSLRTAANHGTRTIVSLSLNIMRMFRFFHASQLVSSNTPWIEPARRPLIPSPRF